MTFLPPDSGVNEKAISAAYAIQLAQQAPLHPAEASAPLASDEPGDIAAMQRVQDTTPGILEPETPPTAPIQLPAERIRRRMAGVVPGQEYRDKAVQTVDPKGQLKLIVTLTMARIREEVRNNSGTDPFKIVQSMINDPGVDTEDIRFLNDYVRHLQQDETLSAPPRHRARK